MINGANETGNFVNSCLEMIQSSMKLNGLMKGYCLEI